MTSIAFLGAGNIAQAIMGGLISNGKDPIDLVAFDPVDACRQHAASLGVRIATNNIEAAGDADIVMLCVKPDVIPSLLEELSDASHNKLLISVAAGITIDTIAGRTVAGTAIVRCMPNTPALVRSGMTALYGNSHVSSTQKQAAEDILGAVGKTLWVDNESALDAVTAVSGSGPAYFFLLMEAMINAGQQLGLGRQVATELVLQTAMGAAQMASTSEHEPSRLRENVTSPGGTTQAALEQFESAGVHEMVNKALQAARQRSIELAES